MNNRIPVIILVSLVLLALIWRLGNPPAPPPPGPYGKFPVWRSTDVFGEPGGSAVSPDGTKWAGAWNSSKETAPGPSVWIIDFAGYEARLCRLSGPAAVTHVSWEDNNTIRALRPESNDTIVYIDAGEAKVERTRHLDPSVRTVLRWPSGSDRLLAEMQAPPDRIRLGVLTPPNVVQGKPIEVELPRGGSLHGQAAFSQDGTLVAFAIDDRDASAGRAFYLGNTADGTARRIFDLGDLPGKVEQMWVSSAGVLIVCSDRETFKAVSYDQAQGKIVPAPTGEALQRAWPDAEKQMLFVTYNGGYKLDLVAGKTARLFDLTKLDEREGAWREAVRSGRLYPVGDRYVAVSEGGPAVDIREITKSGKAGRRLLARM